MPENIATLVGQPTPAFEMDSTAGSKHLADYRGKPLLLAFFPLAFTGG